MFLLMKQEAMHKCTHVCAPKRTATQIHTRQVAYPVLVGRPHPEGHPDYPRMGRFFSVQVPEIAPVHHPSIISPVFMPAWIRFMNRLARGE